MPYNEVPLEELLGKTLVKAEKVKARAGRDIATGDDNYADEIVFITNLGVEYRLFHDQDCCEGVSVEDIVGNLADLVGAPILMAECVTHENVNPEDAPRKGEDSFTWTFYKFATIKGYVTIRWYGESNGYYSEEVTFARMEAA